MSRFTDIRAPLIPPGPAAPAHYLGWVIYPEEPKRRERFIAAALRLILKHEGLNPKDQPEELKRAAPDQPKYLIPIVQSGEARLMRYRLRAAYDALHMLSARPAHPDSGDRIAGPDSFAAADARWLAMSHKVEPPYSVDPRDARKNIWKPSRPVLPMATALLYEPETLAELLRQCRAGILMDVEPDGAFIMDPGSRLSDHRWVEGAVAASRDLAAPLVADLLRPNEPVYLPRLTA